MKKKKRIFWLINLTFKVCYFLEQVLTEQINNSLEVKELLDTVRYWI